MKNILVLMAITFLPLNYSLKENDLPLNDSLVKNQNGDKGINAAGGLYTQSQKGTDANNTPKGWPWRGVCVTYSNAEGLNINKDLPYLKSLGVNFISIYFRPKNFEISKNINSTLAFQEDLKFVDSILDECKVLNMFAMVYLSDFSTVSNKEFNPSSATFWANKKALDLAYEEITRVINHFKNRGDELQAYQFVGEPLLERNGKYITPPNWDSLFLKVYNYAKDNDPQRFILYTPGLGGGPKSYQNLKPIVDDPKIIYAFHYYLPHNYTHQGIGMRNKKYTYPGVIDGQYWNKNTIENSISDVVKFKNKYKKLIFVGEFSATYNAQGCYEYINDLLSVINDNGFSYTYFIWKGYPGWAVFNNKKVSQRQTNMRLKLLSKYWKLD
ncbi:MAG TPA: cellulase family glycosylhydrolase [Edaphocola sp.]|nr:cellulase family glycosylhydrolase [Edaphocola sp.]